MAIDAANGALENQVQIPLHLRDGHYAGKQRHKTIHQDYRIPMLILKSGSSNNIFG